MTGGGDRISIAAALTGHAPGTAVTGSSQWIFAVGAALYTVAAGAALPRRPAPGVQPSTGQPEHVAASLAAYLLLGLIFASAYRFVQIVSPPMFSQPDTNGFTYVYFSYVTLTTIGYGDFTAHNDGGRAIAILEGLFGQVFLVTIVALVVSNLGRDRQVLRQLPTDPDDPETGTEAGTEVDADAQEPSGAAGGAADGQ